MPTARLICVGSELLRGKINTHASTLSRRLMALGIPLVHEQSLPDDQAVLTDVIRQALGQHDLVMVTGGLGPTFDDLSREAAADATGKRLIRSAALVRTIQAKFRKARYKSMPPANLRQADLMDGAESIFNSHGTAPGQWLELSGKVLILLPGPPRELIPMLDAFVIPRLKKTFHSRPRAEGHLHFSGIAESVADDKIRPILKRIKPSRGTVIDYTILASPGLVDFDVFVESDSAKVSQKCCNRVIKAVRASLRDACFGENDEYPLEKVIGHQLTQRRWTLAVAESCTGGLLAGKLTDAAGSSSFFRGGTVVYANEAKTELLGVDPSLIRKEGAVSEPVARAMADSIRRRLKSTLALSITGIAGPDGGTPEKPVGLVFIGLSTPRGTAVRRFQFSGARDSIRTRSVIAALDWLRLACQKKSISLQ